jgi:hypothetical protein
MRVFPNPDVQDKSWTPDILKVHLIFMDRREELLRAMLSFD